MENRKIEPQTNKLLKLELTSQEYTYDRKGRIVYENNIYAKSQINGQNNTVYWRCMDHKKTGCRASIKTTGKVLSIVRGDHSHVNPKIKKSYQIPIWDERIL